MHFVDSWSRGLIFFGRRRMLFTWKVNGCTLVRPPFHPPRTALNLPTLILNPSPNSIEPSTGSPTTGIRIIHYCNRRPQPASQKSNPRRCPRQQKHKSPPAMTPHILEGPEHTIRHANSDPQSPGGTMPATSRDNRSPRRASPKISATSEGRRGESKGA
ncbi:hypothetical protein CC80DRAFT_125879 [Byssothecium circinans]|uniref:Uncharacterized protein n=1 Tax=Byssothecium circinans TaxID=147558 RepID=A0A6A5TQ79_9PLEO|nr:hypothetical protein CC80DRAFT_125879 [Byssothecium circinans]